VLVSCRQGFCGHPGGHHFSIDPAEAQVISPTGRRLRQAPPMRKVISMEDTVVELDVSRAEAEIRSLIAIYERALNTGDAALAAGCYAADALMMAAGQPTVAGPDLLDAYRAGFRVFRMEVEFAVDELIVADHSVAYALTRSTGHQIIFATGARNPDHLRDWRAEP
jgi:hypothetical protein